MTQTIDPVKLKAKAERLEWVLRQYPDIEEVQDLLEALIPLIEDSKLERIMNPVEKIPCEYNLAEGTYRTYQDPNVEEAYVQFIVELEGGLSDEDRKRIADTQSMIDDVNRHG